MPGIFTKPLSLSKEFAGHNNPLDLIGSFIDLADLRIAHMALCRVFLNVTITAKDLDALMATSEAKYLDMADSFSKS
jgi:hypothetical protein